MAIEFTTPTAAYDNYVRAFKAGVKVVRGSTGWQKDHAADVKKLIDEGGYTCDIEVDGGINPDTAKKVIAAGANVLVAGSDVFKQADRNARIAQLRG